MDSRLEIVTRSQLHLSEQTLAALEGQLEALAALCGREKRSADRLALACAAALTARTPESEGARSLSDYLLGSRAWAEAQEDWPAVQYAAQRLLEKLCAGAKVSPVLLAALVRRLDPSAGPVRAALAAYFQAYCEEQGYRGVRPCPAAPAGKGTALVVGLSAGGTGGRLSRSGFGSGRRSGVSGARSGLWGSGKGRGSGFGSGFGSFRRSGRRSGLSGFGSGPADELDGLPPEELENWGGYGLALIEKEDTEAERIARLLRELEGPEGL